MTSKRFIVVGLNQGHNGGCAIIVNGQIKCAIAEERLNRQRYSNGYINSLIYCLKSANIKLSEVDLFVFSSYGPNLSPHYSGDLPYLGIDSKKCIAVDHHLSHAYGSFLTSPFQKALIVIIDGQGNEFMTESYYAGDGSSITKIGGNNPKRSPAKGIGRTYEAFTNFLGWTDDEAGKTMGLAAYGNPNYCKIPLFRLKEDKVEGDLNYTHEQGVIDFMRRKKVTFGMPYAKGKTDLSQHAAAYIQRQTEEIILNLVKHLVRKTGLKNLCIGGGVGLNCLTNTRLLHESEIENIFVLPASSDQGQALGNALYGYYFLTGQKSHITIETDYFGKSYSEKDILNTLKRHPWYISNKIIPNKEFKYSKKNNVEKVAAQLIAVGKIVGWFQGGSELGPRALGNRSILADPRDLNSKEKLNKKIKKREEFRPFAPSVLLEGSPSFFNIDIPSPFMLLAPKVKPEVAQLIPAVVHKDGTSRIQTVKKTQNERFYNLINEFYKITNIPLILNTSFNSQGPIVETPFNALATFLSTDMDFLIIDDYLISKSG